MSAREVRRQARIGTQVLFLGLWGGALGCSSPPAESPTHARVTRGCLSQQDCQALWAEARAREQECRSSPNGRDCATESGDAEQALRLFEPYQRAARERMAQLERQREAARAEEERRRNEEAERRSREEANLAEERRNVAELAEKDRALREAVRPATYRQMTATGRAAYLRDCLGQGREAVAAPILEAEGAEAERLACDVLLLRLLEATDSEAEKTALLGQLQRYVSAQSESTQPRRARPSRAPGDDRAHSASRALCCDGRPSPSCSCGGGRG